MLQKQEQAPKCGSNEEGKKCKSKLALGSEEVITISILKEAFPRKLLGINTIPNTETDIKSIMHSLNAKTHQVMIEYQVKF
jgi:hypothetical protein